jgi:signal peptidase I
MRFIEILLAATVITGLIWLLDSLIWRPKRLMNVFGKKSGLKQQDNEPIIVEYSRAFFPILLLVLILRTFLAEPFRIPSGSMHPTLLEGDFILVNKYDYGLRLPISGNKIVNIGNPKRGDVVVFKHTKRGESIDMIKRVVGLPGDKVEYKDKTIYINGEAVKQELVRETVDKEPGQNTGWPVNEYIETLGTVRHDIYVQNDSSPSPSQYRYNDVVVPENSYFVMGDNRDNSDDSRYWGFVKDEDILGRALLIWLSFDTSRNGFADCLKHCVRWDRIGDGLALKDEQTLASKTEAEARVFKDKEANKAKESNKINEPRKASEDKKISESNKGSESNKSSEDNKANEANKVNENNKVKATKAEAIMPDPTKVEPAQIMNTTVDPGKDKVPAAPANSAPAKSAEQTAKPTGDSAKDNKDFTKSSPEGVVKSQSQPQTQQPSIESDKGKDKSKT